MTALCSCGHKWSDYSTELRWKEYADSKATNCFPCWKIKTERVESSKRALTGITYLRIEGEIKEIPLFECKEHGAMLVMEPGRVVQRCQACHVGVIVEKNDTCDCGK